MYVRDVKTGEVKLVKGPQTYLLNNHEQEWEKVLDPTVEMLLAHNGYIPMTVDDKGNYIYSYSS